MPYFTCNTQKIFGFAIENHQQADLVFSPQTHKYYANVSDNTDEIIELSEPEEFWSVVDALIREE